MLDFITWTADPAIFSIGSREIRWYGLAFAIGFLIGYKIVEKMWKREKLNPAWIDSLLIYTMLGTVIGARLGHCLFYAPDYYLANPLEILKVWEGGLASHGGTLGIIIAIYFYSKRVSHRSMLWTFDKLVVPTGLVAAMIRLGNLMNHEIYGHPTDLPWGFRFIENLHAWKRGAAPVFTAPSHPTQLYEAASYLVTFVICMWLYFKKDAWKKEGLIFGVFMICVFGSRFFIEFLKNDQEEFEADMMLNMGQWLSIPFVLAGIYFVWRAMRLGKGMKKIFFKVCCLALLTAGNIACTGQGKINKGESAAADSVAVVMENETALQADSTGYIVKVGNMAPDFTVTLTDGKSVSLSALRGKVVMLQFTASWCGVCRKEMPFIEKDIWLKHKNNPEFALIGIDRDEPLDKVLAFAKTTGVTYPLGLDPGADIFAKYALRNSGITRNVLIDREGKIVKLTRLYNEEEFASLVRQIDEMLKK